MPEGMTGPQGQANPNPAEGQPPMNQMEPGAAGQAGSEAQPVGGTEPAAAPDAQPQLQPGTAPEGAMPAAGGEQPPPETQPAEGVGAQAGETTPDPFGEFLAAYGMTEKEPETSEVASGRPTLPYGEIGKMLGEKTDENGQKLRNYQITTFDEHGQPQKRETGWMGVEDLADLGMRKWNSAELSFADQQRAAQASASAERPAGKGPEDTFFGAPDELFSAPPTERGDAPAGDGLFDLTESAAGFTPSPAEQEVAPQTQQGFTVQQIALARGERAAFQDWLAKNENSIRQRVANANTHVDEDGNRTPAITREEYEAEVEAEIQNKFEAYKKIPSGSAQIQQHARQQMQMIQEQFAQDDANAEAVLGRYASNLLPAMQSFSQRVVMQGFAARTPEEAFLARNANFANGRLLTALALHALKLGRELPQKLEAARAEERSKLLQEMKEKWADHRAGKGKAAAQPAAQVIDAETRAAVPGAGGMRAPGATAPGVPGMPTDTPDAFTEEWRKTQDILHQRFREPGRGA